MKRIWPSARIAGHASPAPYYRHRVDDCCRRFRRDVSGGLRRSAALFSRHALVLELIALAGFLFFSVVWLIVAVATPAPVVVADVARIQARRIHDKLPSQIREKLPEITQEFLRKAEKSN